MTPLLFALLASPLLGPSVWQPTAAQLVALGEDVLVVPRPPAAPRSPADVLGHLLAHLPADRPLVLVPHSNAGLYVPAVIAQRDVVATVFVDAGLPPEQGSVPLSPPAMAGFLDGLADADGMLPPWTRWWTPEQLAEVLPDPAVRAAVEADQHRLPRSYSAAEIDVPAGWASRPAAYLAFGDTYAEERERARTYHWPVETLPGGHLHQLADPAAVARAVAHLADRLLSHRPG